MLGSSSKKEVGKPSIPSTVGQECLAGTQSPNASYCSSRRIDVWVGEVVVVVDLVHSSGSVRCLAVGSSPLVADSSSPADSLAEALGSVGLVVVWVRSCSSAVVLRQEGRGTVLDWFDCDWDNRLVCHQDSHLGLGLGRMKGLGHMREGLGHMQGAVVC